jgi:hypothetical protein
VVEDGHVARRIRDHRVQRQVAGSRCERPNAALRLRDFDDAR